MKKKGKAKDPIGSVMVVGGGIAGIQASLDLANGGYKVHLVEGSPSIGGTMAQLDKTFPTNDCSMCILSPKLVEAGRHLNVELTTLGEVKKVDGKAGNFKVKVLKKARYVDEEKCTGCGECLEQCPTRFIPDFVEPPASIPVRQSDKEVVDRLVKDHGTSGSSLLRVMQAVNDELRYIPKGVVYYLSDCFSVPVSLIYRIGTFYTAFSFTPRGKNIISVCAGTACHIKGADKLVDEMKRELSIDLDGTTEDLLFSLETVRCLGCCSLAPVIKINDRVYGSVKTSEIPKILKDYRK